MSAGDGAGPGRSAHPPGAAAVSLALILSQGVYALAAWFVVGDDWAPLAGGSSVVVGPATAAASLGILLLSWAVPARLVSSAAPEERDRRRFTAHILAQAMRESVGVLGLVASLLTGELLWAGGLAAVAAAALLLGWLQERAG